MAVALVPKRAFARYICIKGVDATKLMTINGRSNKKDVDTLYQNLNYLNDRC